jgi:hypothetical protein
MCLCRRCLPQVSCAFYSPTLLALPHARAERGRVCCAALAPAPASPAPAVPPAKNASATTPMSVPAPASAPPAAQQPPGTTPATGTIAVRAPYGLAPAVRGGSPFAHALTRVRRAGSADARKVQRGRSRPVNHCAGRQRGRGRCGADQAAVVGSPARWALRHGPALQLWQ